MNFKIINVHNLRMPMSLRKNMTNFLVYKYELNVDKLPT